MSNIQDVIKNRRSIFPRMFSGELIADDKIQLLLEAANWAPNHKHTEPWRFTVFAGEGRNKLAKLQGDLYKKVAQEKGNFDEVLHGKLQKNPLKSSHVIAIGCKISGKVPQIEETNATACAVQNMQLVASTIGIGCYWGTGGITYFEEAKSFFKLEDQDKFMGFLYLGTFNNTLPQGKRNSVVDKVKWVV